MNGAALILAGGAGTRLRPLSTDENPKQFLRIFDGRSLMEMTWERAAQLVSPAEIFVSTNERYAAQCREHLPALAGSNLITEPARRNNAPAIAVSCLAIEAALGSDAVIAVLPSDHYIADQEEFLRVMRTAMEFAAASNTLVTIGIEPTEPNIGYGYLELGPSLGGEMIQLERFIEKPSRERAEELLQSGRYAWNAGIFVWRAGAFHTELAAAAPQIARAAAHILSMENLALRAAIYEAMPAISIDYALMEKCSHVATIRGDFGWSDVGTFEALARVGVDVSEYLQRPPS
ncbi:MAG: mannose-1-phosphate guanylyltransferase [Thermoanaerobaculia bacterium]